MKTVRVALEEEAIRRGALQVPSELAGLIDFVRSRPEPKTVMEIGTAKGGTLWLWCRLASLDAMILSVDLPGGPFGGGYGRDDVLRLANYPNPGQRLKLIQGDSHSPRMLRAVQSSLGGRLLDILFIDGDHTLEGVTKDWEMYSPLVRPGGIVVFHDIVEHPHFPECQVKPLWDRLKTEFTHWEFCVDGGEWGGIGVLEVPETGLLAGREQTPEGC